MVGVFVFLRERVGGDDSKRGRPLDAVKFYDNELVGTIPSEVGLLTPLTYLDFYDNDLTSTIPSEIGLLTQLTYLDFYDNALTSTIPSKIGLLTQLAFLSFYDNTLMGKIPSSLCSLTSLEAVYIYCREITCPTGCCISGDGTSCGLMCEGRKGRQLSRTEVVEPKQVVEPKF